MTTRVQICVPESALDDPRYGEAIDYDQRIGRLAQNGTTLVNIDGEVIQFPAGWIKPYHET